MNVIPYTWNTILIFHLYYAFSLKLSLVMLLLQRVMHSCVWLFATAWTARLLCPWNFPGKNTSLGCHSFLQGIFPTQGSNLGLLHCRQVLYHLNHQGSPWWCWAELNTISASISLCIWGCKLWTLWETISYSSVYSKRLACTRSLINAYWKQNIT